MLIKKMIFITLSVIACLYTSMVFASQDAPSSLAGKIFRTSITQGTGGFHNAIGKILEDNFINTYQFVSHEIGNNDIETAEYNYLKQNKDIGTLIISHNSGKYKGLIYKSVLDFHTGRFQITGISTRDTASGWFEIIK